LRRVPEACGPKEFDIKNPRHSSVGRR